MSNSEHNAKILPIMIYHMKLIQDNSYENIRKNQIWFVLDIENANNDDENKIS